MSDTSKTLKAALSAYYADHPSLPDGIYLGLSADRYHADTALGSSNIRDALKNHFWFKSPMNPKKPKEKMTTAKVLGVATHRLLLEGHQKFNAEYIRGPYGDEDDYTPAEKTALTKAAKAKLDEGQELLPQVEYDFVLGCKDIIDRDPELKGCLDNALTEVSIFWTRPDDVRCKVRLDALKIRGIGDIKTIANERERDLPEACRLDIHTYRYDIPAEHYSAGRDHLPALLAAGDVYAGDELAKLDPKNNSDAAVLDFLGKCAAQKKFGFQLVFIPKKGSPDAWSCTLSRGNPILVAATHDIDEAIHRFKYSIEKFGHKQPWLPERKVEELDIDMMPLTFGRRAR